MCWAKTIGQSAELLLLRSGLNLEAQRGRPNEVGQLAAHET
jgi:hypothetical protein